MTISKVIAVSAFGLLITASANASTDQMQIEGAAPAVEQPAGVAHQHQLPNGSFVTHTHVNGGDTSHTHTMAEVKKALQLQ